MEVTAPSTSVARPQPQEPATRHDDWQPVQRQNMGGKQQAHEKGQKRGPNPEQKQQSQSGAKQPARKGGKQQQQPQGGAVPKQQQQQQGGSKQQQQGGAVHQQNVPKKQPQSEVKQPQHQDGAWQQPQSSAWGQKPKHQPQASGSQTQFEKGHGGAINKPPKESQPTDGGGRGGKPAAKSAPEENLPVLKVAPKKPGTKGKPMPPIETNFLSLMKLNQLVDNIYKYDVEIVAKKEAKGPRKLFTSAFIQFNRQYFPQDHLPYDGKKIAFANRELPIDGEQSGDVIVRHPDTGKNCAYTITIKPVSTDTGFAIAVKAPMMR